MCRPTSSSTKEAGCADARRGRLASRFSNRHCSATSSPNDQPHISKISFGRNSMLNRSDSQASFAPTAPQIGWLDPRQIALSLSAGAMAGLLDLGVLLSLAALIFSGPLAGFVANGIGLILVGTCALNVVLALLSSRPAIVGTAQD